MSGEAVEIGLNGPRISSGASGAAVQNLNLMLGLAEDAGL